MLESGRIRLVRPSAVSSQYHPEHVSARQNFRKFYS
jgi:hypothetical protein